MDDDFDVDDGPKENISETKRVSRNMNEKKRRDRFNVLISELAAVIPDSTAVGTSKIDKTTVLKKAVAYLRSHSNRSTVALSRPTANWQPAFVNDAELNQVLLEAMSGFLLVLDGSGIITFASDSIISILGYRPQDVVNNSVADYLDQTDKSCIFAHLALLEKLKSSTQESSNSTYSSVAVSDPVNFEMTLNSGPCFKSQVVECFSCIGQAFTTNAAPHSSSNFQVIVICYSSNSKPNLTQPLFDVTSKEFTSRLTLDWKFTCVDNRIMLVLGYQPSELVNKSIYAFIHHEDLVNIKTYHEMLVRKGRINTCYYRFLTKGEPFDLYINRKTNRIEFDAHYKKTNTNVNFKKKSNHPPHIKRAVIKGFAERARHLCDDENKVEAELENVEEVFVANKYTQEEIKETIHQTKKDTQTKTKDTTENQRETYVVPCMRGLSYDFHIWLCMYGADVHIEGAYVHIEGADVPITWRRT
ncbi:Circadian locomoter output cycles protein kaput [Exaiptasia diaphana]|nr:Circadian locomoter output cycles protein kaput [Exaiptasia diaphana]